MRKIYVSDGGNDKDDGLLVLRLTMLSNVLSAA